MNNINSLIILMSITIIMFLSCESPDPNLDNSGVDELKALEIDRTLKPQEQKYHDILYVPIYSDIYADNQSQKKLLAATLSIRNTSYEDSLFVSKIDYFNTEGKIVRSFIDNVINIPPMATVNYVIEKHDDTGGHGANFIVELNAKNKDIRPLIQAIMISQSGNQSFAFSTDAYSIIKDD